LVGKGLTFHGLRHTVGAIARGANASDWSLAAALGDRSTAMAQVYGRDADRRAAQRDVMLKVQKHIETVFVENGVENDAKPPHKASGNR
jgi:integrase